MYLHIHCHRNVRNVKLFKFFLLVLNKTKLIHEITNPDGQLGEPGLGAGRQDRHRHLRRASRCPLHGVQVHKV